MHTPSHQLTLLKHLYKNIKDKRPNGEETQALTFHWFLNSVCNANTSEYRRKHFKRTEITDVFIKTRLAIMYRGLKYGVLGKYAAGYECYDFDFKLVAKPQPDTHYIVYSKDVDSPSLISKGIIWPKMEDVATFSVRTECGTCTHPSNAVAAWKAQHSLNSFFGVKNGGMPKAGMANYDIFGYMCCYLPSRKFGHDGPCNKATNYNAIKEYERVIKANAPKPKAVKSVKPRKDKT